MLLFGSHAPAVVPYVLSFAAGSFLYVAMADLIPTLHRGTLDRNAIRQLILIGLGIGTMVLVQCRALLTGALALAAAISLGGQSTIPPVVMPPTTSPAARASRRSDRLRHDAEGNLDRPDRRSRGR